MGEGPCVYHGAHVEVTGQHCGVGPLLSTSEFCKSDEVPHVCTASVITSELCLTLSFIGHQSTS